MGIDARGRGVFAVAQRWEEYDQTILPAVAAEVPAETRALLQLAFYFGARSMLDLVGTALDDADGLQALEARLDRLCDEVDLFLEAGDGELN